ncbi:trypsin alpha-3 [Ceratitis capitata]|uniref:Vitellin-degrading protease n=1 Tax=Ceratitis capitata TaxID=7213 RepID=W8CBM0_CERCA|nr:trypsin alpha-3 [Ceratitis capitata]
MGIELQFILQVILYFHLRNVFGADGNQRIVGGTPVMVKQYPYYVRLHYGSEFKCGGSLIRDNAVLTAAHCVVDFNVKMLRIHADTINLYDIGIVRTAKNVLISQAYDENTMNYDVAVLILSSPIPPTSATPIPLNKIPVAPGMKCLVMGHGLQSENGWGSAQLQEVQVPVLSRALCKIKYAFREYISPSMMCASTPGKDSCSGDSGGPMVCNERQAGIVSWGYGCGKALYPGVYTDVSKIYGFIEKVLEQYP